MTYQAGDDATWTVPVIDSNGGPLSDAVTVTARNSAGDTVTIDDADWDGATAPGENGATTRQLGVPLATIPAGLWSLRLSVTDDADLFLGNVYIQ